MTTLESGRNAFGVPCKAELPGEDCMPSVPSRSLKPSSFHTDFSSRNQADGSAAEALLFEQKGPRQPPLSRTPLTKNHDGQSDNGHVGNKTEEKAKSVSGDPRVFKKNSYEVFKLLKTATKRVDLLFAARAFNALRDLGVQQLSPDLAALVRAIRRPLFALVVRHRKADNAFKTKLAELTDLKILAKRSPEAPPQSDIGSTIRLLSEDLKSFIFTGRFCHNQGLIDSRVQACLESDANSETPQVLASESVSSVPEKLQLLQKKQVHHESFREFSNTPNQSSQMTNVEQSLSRSNMFKKMRKNNLSESRCNFRPRVESAKINFINIKSKIDCWNLPAKKPRLTTETESQLSRSDAKDLSKLHEKFKNQYAKPFLKSLKKVEGYETEAGLAKSRKELSVSVHTKLVPKISFPDASVSSKKSVPRHRDPAFKFYSLVRPSKQVLAKQSARGVGGPGGQRSDAKRGDDRLTFEEIRETYQQKYLGVLVRVFEKATFRQNSRVDNFDCQRLLVNGAGFSDFQLEGSSFRELMHFVDRRFDKITTG